jgi:hypothetical protein
VLSLKNAGPSMLWLQSITNPHYIYTPHINWKSFSPLKIAMGSFVFTMERINKHFMHEIAEKSPHKKQPFEGKTTQRRTPCPVSSTQERRRQRQRQRVTEKTKLQCCNCVFPQVVTRILRSGCKIKAWIFGENVEHEGLL